MLHSFGSPYECCTNSKMPLDWNGNWQEEYAFLPIFCVLGVCVPDYEYHLINGQCLIADTSPHNLHTDAFGQVVQLERKTREASFIFSVVYIQR